MTWIRGIGIVLVVIGATILLYGMNEADSFSEQWNKFFTGRFSDGTIVYLVAGVATLAVGGSMLIFGGRRRAT